MAKYNRNSGKSWDDKQVNQLEKLAKKNTPTRVIGLIMGRTPDAIYKKASQEKIGLDPTNQSPYNRRRK
ncbi:MAG: hypothetical protein UR62_C0003G0012 [Candidatus Nomurabacteria bacterium GW2011_GWF2_35_12]|uniref:Uncharacterized protein n=3 Tax=Candidatus Nomuraibacteriota TaxID=1752729 RepID=A0A0G0E9S0_9BACT|nr:MAG: hypothetical protein UR62_C0003G0012 [Candidatus Nomurabacteria bacterium GW2011_GWF2_35_12]KKP71974.1 MAG: hypothetical protein UR70_C0015G0003 [Candidatus Nomurabacteria bacterium GW2011_GWB1_35_20]KKP76706.1 MAG: hypothetical protein UR72_C0001G0151 [Parcubacteria group bacterium GW2011_GWC1_35_21]KKP78405.1 MAG: hypothetical protein UR77_C0003G0012 [Candidatus Nomurabacteria bacterium GW2011_GWC2_35_35]KKP88426.1 MAG: hypothetical protein UR92_C0005G0013 [Candidatus Nomurabacteria b